MTLSSRLSSSFASISQFWRTAPRHRQRVALVAVLFATLVSESVVAQQTAAQRRDELNRVADLINDPDPNQRLGNFEILVAEGDAVKVQIAVQTAMASRDRMLRAMAFRSYIASVQQLILDFKLSPALQKEADEARVKGTMAQLENRLPGITGLLKTGMRVSLTFVEFDHKTANGNLHSSLRSVSNIIPFKVVGERLTFIHTVNFIDRNCNFEISPKGGDQVGGFLSCINWGLGRVDLVGDLY